MVSILDMQHMRYINLFEKFSNVSTRHCFDYNETITFAVPKHLVPKAVGKNGANVKKLNEILGKKIKIISTPEDINDIKEFIGAIVSPVHFRDLQFDDNEIIINAGAENKAALIGRNKRRLLELQKIAKAYFGKELRIV